MTAAGGKRRILFVAMQNSIHVARWVAQLAERGWDLHLFPVSNAAPHPALRGVTIHWPMARFWPRLTARLLARDPLALLRKPLSLDQKLFPGIATRSVTRLPSVGAVDILYRFVPGLRGSGIAPRRLSPFGPAVLAPLIERLRPDLVHSIEFQHAAYRVLWAREAAGKLPPWLATNYGSDIYHYRTIPEHREIIGRVLAAADFYACECRRDVALARELGFAGHAVPVMPNAGGFAQEDLARLASGVPPSQRRIVMVKGYQHFAGRALTALDALERCADALQGYRIVVFSCMPNVKPRVRELARSGRLDIAALDHVPHDEMLRLHGQARLYLGVGVSDAISTSMLEAMAMGAFPIQTNTACCDEWIEDGASGFIIPPDDVGVIADRVHRALAEDALVDRAAGINAETVRLRLDAAALRRQALAMYDQVFAAIDARKEAV